MRERNSHEKILVPAGTQPKTIKPLRVDPLRQGHNTIYLSTKDTFFHPISLRLLLNTFYSLVLVVITNSLLVQLPNFRYCHPFRLVLYLGCGVNYISIQLLRGCTSALLKEIKGSQINGFPNTSWISTTTLQRTQQLNLCCPQWILRSDFTVPVRDTYTTEPMEEQQTSYM